LNDLPDDRINQPDAELYGVFTLFPNRAEKFLILKGPCGRPPFADGHRLRAAIIFRRRIIRQKSQKRNLFNAVVSALSRG